MRQGAKTYPSIGVGIALLLGGGRTQNAVPQSPWQILGPVRFEVAGITDSDAYLVYAYRIVNPTSSRGGVAMVELDLSAPAGTGHVKLPSSGATDPDTRDSVDHVPSGAIAPPRWKSMLVGYKGAMAWYVYTVLVNGWPSSFDSVSAGAAKDGFGVRSSYLPGVRDFSAIPTEQSCCRTPNAQGELPNSLTFRARGFSVGPTVRPDQMTLNLLRTDLDQACGPLRWIVDGTVCGTLHAKLASATPDWRGFLDTLDAQHGTGKPVNDNAYWLLKVNGEYLLAHK